MRNLALAILVFILHPQARAFQDATPQAQVDTLIAHSRKTMNLDVDRGDSLAGAALTLALQTGYTRGEAHAHAQQGLADFYRGNNKEAVKAYLEALKTYEKNKLPTDLVYGLVMVRLAAIFHSEQDWAQNRYYLKKAEAAAKTTDDDRLLGMAYLETAHTHTSLQHYDSAFYFYEAALKQFNHTGDRLNAAGVHTNIGINYFYMGQYARAIDYYKKGLALNRQIGRNMQASHALYNIGEAYYYLHVYPQTIAYMDSAYTTAASAGQYGGVSDMYLLKARAFSSLKKPTRRPDTSRR
jgi:tetratricopeptide (TPR) repeat protein